jgi:hypothetical protein
MPSLARWPTVKSFHRLSSASSRRRAHSSRAQGLNGAEFDHRWRRRNGKEDPPPVEGIEMLMGAPARRAAIW